MSSGALNEAAVNAHVLNGEAGPRRIEGGAACRVVAGVAARGTRRVLGIGSVRLSLASAADPTLPAVGAGAAVVGATAAASGTRRRPGAGSAGVSIGTGAAARYRALARAPVARTHVLPNELREFRIGAEPTDATLPERRPFLVPRETRGR